MSHKNKQLMTLRKKIRVGISIGDLNGVGLEVILKTFRDKRMLEFCTPVLFGSSKALSYHKKILDLKAKYDPERLFYSDATKRLLMDS